jgi:hypothetical protein
MAGKLRHSIIPNASDIDLLLANWAFKPGLI